MSERRHDADRAAWWLWVVSVNWGRGYTPAKFRRNVLRVVNRIDGKTHVVILPTELDEADAAPEHDIFAAMLEPGTKKAGWHTYEPIVASPAFTMSRERVTVTMRAGLELDPPAPKGTGPVRHAVTCVCEDEGLRVGIGNTHPHRDLPIPTVQKARREGEGVFRGQLMSVYQSGPGTSTVWAADPNGRFPTMIPGEKTAIQHGGTRDCIRYKEHPRGARLDLRDKGTLEGTIDPHDPLWALFRVSARAAA